MRTSHSRDGEFAFRMKHELERRGGASRLRVLRKPGPKRFEEKRTKTLPKKKPAICLLGQSRALGWGLVESFPNAHVVGENALPV